MKPAAVIGIGNPLMKDEGVGVHVAEALRDTAEVPGVEFLDGGTAGMVILRMMADRPKVVFVDCAMMGEDPGRMRRFTPDEVKDRKILNGLSLHEGNLLDTIDLSRQLGELPRDVVIYGIQPAEVGIGEELSPVLADRMKEYTREILAEVREGGADA